MRKTLLLALAALALPTVASAQTVLSAGQLVLVQVSADGTKPITFVPLVSLAATTTISFTDNGYGTLNSTFRTNEGFVTWTAPAGGVAAGTQVTINNNGGGNNNTASTGSVTTSTNFNLSGSGDQVFAYQGTLASPTLIFAVNWANAGWNTTSSNAASLTSNNSNNPLGSNGVELGNLDNYGYTGTGSSDAATFLANVQASANWSGDDTAPVSPTPGSLPVELVSFSGLGTTSGARLAWTTASETNNAGFAVEQQTGDTWTERGFVAGRGTTTERSDYTFEVSGLTAGSHAFRLRQTDTDGTVHYSAVATVEVAVDGDSRVTLLGQRAVRVETNEAQAVSVRVFDVLGRVVSQQRSDVSGTGVFELPTMAAGAYVVRVEGERFAQTRTLVVR